MFALKQSDNQKVLQEIFERFNQSSNKLEERYAALSLEVDKLRIELKEKNEEVQRHEKLALLGKTAAALAHEVRNPLGSIKLFLDLLKEDCSDRPLALESIEHISRSLVMLDNVVSNILHFARNEKVERTVLNIHSIIQEQVQAIVSKAHSELEVEVSLTADSFILGNEHALRQVFSNIILNSAQALKYKGKILIKSFNQDDGIGIEISDNGPGVSSSIREKLFEPFVTTRSEGTGLGLAIVRHIIDLHKGKIFLREGQGAIFVIWLPKK